MLAVIGWHLVYLALIALTGFVILFVAASWSHLRYQIHEWKKRSC